MAIKPIVCSRCGGKTGQYAEVDSDKLNPVDKHLFMEDCIQELVERIERLEGKK